MKIVGISQRIDVFPDRNEVRDALDQHLIDFLLAAGFTPIPIPNRLNQTLSDGRHDRGALDVWLSAVRPQGIVLSGGNNIGQFIDRDLTENLLIDYASQNQLPLLGICRGMQVMAQWAGVGLHPAQGHTRTRHSIFGEINGEVNSYHDFSLQTCPEGFRILARSEEGEIEAISHESLSWEGWMWHPEREDFFDSRDIARVKTLFGE